MMYTQEGQDTPGTAWSGMDRMMYVYTSLEMYASVDVFRDVES